MQLLAVAVGCVTIAGWIILSKRGHETLSIGSKSGVSAERVPSVPLYETTAEQLFRDYDANAVAAQDRIGGRRIRVRGIVSAIDEDAAGHALVKFSTSPATSLDFQLDDDQKGAAAQLVKGETANIECSKVRHGLASPVATDCTMASPDANPGTSYLAVAFSEVHGQSPLYIVGPMSESVCTERSEYLSRQLVADGHMVSKSCTASAQASLPVEKECRLGSSMAAVPDIPAAHLWRYTCGTHIDKKSSGRAVPALAVQTVPAKSTARTPVASDDAAPKPLPAAVAGDAAVESTPSSAREEPTPVLAAAGTSAETADAVPSPVPGGVVTPVKDSSALPTDLDAVSAQDPAAANRINAYCTQVTATATSKQTVALGCRHEEVAAWNRFAVQNEFPTLDDTARQKCNEPPFPDSYVAKEACAKYQLQLN